MSLALSTATMRRHGIVPGILVSLALHVLLIFCYRLAAPTPPPELPPKRTMTVWLHTFTPTPTAVEKIRPAQPAVISPAPASSGSPPAIERTAQARADQTPGRPAPAPDHGTATGATAVTAVTVTAATAATTEAITAPAAADDPLRAPAATSFDMQAARREARRVATEKDTQRADSLAKRLEEHPLYADDKETALQKGIAGAQRGDCRNSGGGLLAPLGWLLDKKDGGCKW